MRLPTEPALPDRTGGDDGRRFLHTVRASAGRGRVLVESAGASAALVLAAAALAVVATGPRAWVLFLDGDSLLFALVHASIAAGQPQRWTLSSPLFLPEVAVYLPVSLLGAPVRVTLLIDALLNWLGYYAVVRAVAATTRVRRSVAVRSGLLAVAALAALAATESSPSRDALEPASLLSTTTYYAGTVVATVGLVALTATALRPGRRTAAVVGAFMLTASSVLTNPLFIAWAVLPLCAVAGLAVLAGADVRRALVLIVAALAATGAGLAARIPFRDMLVQDSAAKIRPDLASASLAYYRGLLAERLDTVGGRLALLLVLVLLVVAVVCGVSAVRSRWVVGTVIAGFAVVAPVAVTVGSIALGTSAVRYLQPVVFAPPLALLLLPRTVPPALRGAGAVRLMTAVAVGCVAGISVPSAVALGRAATADDSSVSCVVRWLDAHPGRTGIGEYWTVRAVKASAPDPRRLVQVDASANGYDWLTDSDDFSRRTFDFTVTDAAEDPPLVVDATPLRILRCGRYTISDYGDRALPVGPAHH